MASDPDHSTEEERFLAIGLSIAGRLVIGGAGLWYLGTAV